MYSTYKVVAYVILLILFAAGIAREHAYEDPSDIKITADSIQNGLKSDSDGTKIDQKQISLGGRHKWTDPTVMTKGNEFENVPDTQIKKQNVTFVDEVEQVLDLANPNDVEEQVSLSELIGYLSKFEDIEFGGEWSLDSSDLVYYINPDFEETQGKARFRFQINTYSNYPGDIYFEFIVRLYEGEYLNRNTEIASHFKMTNGTSYGIQKTAQLVRIENGRLFSKPSQRDVLSDLLIKFEENERTGVKSVNFSLKSIKGNQIDLNLDFSYPYSDMTSFWSVFLYSFILLCVCVVFCNELINQTKRADESPLVAQRLSLFTLSWNTMWNMWLFNIHSTYALNDSNYYMLSLPSVMYFIICIVFEITLLHICWKARNNNLALENPEEVRRQIIIFYLKFYISYIIAVSLSDMIFSNCALLIMINGFIWFPQIYENVKNRARNVPKPMFAITLSVSQGFMPIYFLFSSQNIFEIRNSPRWAFTLLILHLGSIMILYGQKKLGSRFFIPKMFRGKSAYQYQQLSEDLEEQSDKDCAICLNCLNEPQGSDEYHRDHDKSFMKTPCGHKFHPYCLKMWMRQKLECPSCRTEIPPLDSDEEEDEES